MIRTPDQRVRVFVSSTLGELAAERQAVRDAVTSLRLVPVMFEAGARAHPPRDLYRAYNAGGTSYQHFSDASELRGLVENDLAVLLSERFERAPARDGAAVRAVRDCEPAAPSGDWSASGGHLRRLTSTRPVSHRVPCP